MSSFEAKKMIADTGFNPCRKDATAGYSKELTDAGTKVWPLFARVSTATEWVSTFHRNAEDLGG